MTQLRTIAWQLLRKCQEETTVHDSTSMAPMKTQQLNLLYFLQNLTIYQNCMLSCSMHYLINYCTKYRKKGEHKVTDNQFKTFV